MPTDEVVNDNNYGENGDDISHDSEDDHSDDEGNCADGDDDLNVSDSTDELDLEDSEEDSDNTVEGDEFSDEEDTGYDDLWSLVMPWGLYTIIILCT